jgi:IS5 family transposase
MSSTKTPARGFFDEETVLLKLSRLNDPLERLLATIDFEQFRPLLEEIFLPKQRKSNAGAKPYDYVMMFKILLLQRLYNLSDEQMEFHITDRLSFRRFLGLALSYQVPDCNTIWNFRETLKEQNNERKLFDWFYQMLERDGLVVNEGKMVDASFHEVPRQRNSRTENEQLKQGEIPEQWNDTPHKLSHKDTDARWTKKNGQTYYGYKNHVKVDTKSKLIDRYEVTSANVHDSQTLETLLNEQDKEQPLYGDSAYTGEAQEQSIATHQMLNRIHEKGYRNQPLTEEQKEHNRQKSKVRARVEHVFGFIENSMGGSFMRCIGIARARVVIGLTNLVYNMCRAVYLGLQMKKIPYAAS